MSCAIHTSSPPDLIRGSMRRPLPMPAGPMDCRVEPGNDQFVGARFNPLTTTRTPPSLPDLVGQSSKRRGPGSRSGVRGYWMPRSSRGMTSKRDLVLYEIVCASASGEGKRPVRTDREDR